MILLGSLIIFLATIRFVPGFNDRVTRLARNLFGYNSGKTIGRLLALPLLFLFYWLVLKTTGNEHNFRKQVDVFMSYPEEVRKQGNKKVLLPFTFLLGLLLLLALT